MFTSISAPIPLQIGCEVVYNAEYPTPLVLLVQPRLDAPVGWIHERRTLTPNVPVSEFFDSYGNRCWRLVVPPGRLEMSYHAVVSVSPEADPVLPDTPKTPVAELPSEVLMYTLPSRYCPTDLLISDAWQLFGHVEGGWAQVQAVCDWMHANIVYGKGSNVHTASDEILRARRGVCRDFAHLAVTFCRALNIPARYVCGYLPEIGVEPDPTPMDFHAWFEAYLDGAWRTFDARHNRPRIGRVIIGYGRDAVDLAWATAYGSARLERISVISEPARLERSDR
ncbi:MAG: transglutaminase family protein [Roseiflexaceae bacterium]|nr:transglutaminase family protein [Roseiflexaceae bacterium]